MTVGSLYSYSLTAADNATADSTQNWAEGQLPSTVNNSARAGMATVAAWLKDINGSLTLAGSANTYTVTTNASFTTLATGRMLGAKCNASNTAASTLNPDILGAKAVRKYTAAGDVALAANDMVTDGQYVFRYDAAANAAAGAWILLNPSALQAPATFTSASANALAVGPNGATNPVFNVNASTASAATGISITGAAAAARVALAVTSSGTDEGLSIDAKGAGTIRLGATSTGAIEFSRNAVPTASDGAALGTTALQWSDVFLASGAVINFANGDVALTHSASTLTTAAAISAGSLSSALSVRAGPAQSIAAGGNNFFMHSFYSTSNFGVGAGSGVPTMSAAKGSLYLRSDGSTTNDRAYINTNGSTTWTALTTAA